MSRDVLLETEYQGYTVLIRATEEEEVVMYPPMHGDKMYSVHIPTATVEEMVKNETINPFLAITLGMVQLAINVRKAVEHDTG